VIRQLCCATSLLALAACATRPPAPPPPQRALSSVAAATAAIERDARQSERVSDARIRGELAADADRNADACLELQPQSAACLYGRALALGLNARVHPARARELLTEMLATLTRAESADPNYDQAGPARARALVLVRAPGWPLGPGDPDGAVAAARRAVALRPNYPPNLLALAEALAKTGDASGARQSYARAREAALAVPAADDRDEWLREADQGLQPNGSANP